MPDSPFNVRSLNLPFRTGATSYVIADDLLPNAQFLADYVQDMQLVLFDVPAGPSNLPDAASVAALAALGRASDLTYTVHLIEDLAPDQPLAEPTSLHKAKAVIQQTRALDPWGYVLHLDGRTVRAPETVPAMVALWQQQIGATLRQLAQWTGDPATLAVENLEGYPPDFVTPAIAATGVSRCVDVGHLWLDGHHPLLWVQAALPHTRIIHLHGLHAGRDHQSLAYLAPTTLDPIIALLLRYPYQGVLTLEVFGEDDFWSSLQTLHASVARCRS